MSANREETLRQFCDVTGADETQSKFFLDSSNWQLEEAISSFYEHGGVEEPAPAAAAPVASPLVMDSDSDMDSAPNSPQTHTKKEKKKTNTKFATLESLQQESSSDEEEAFQAHMLESTVTKIKRITQDFLDQCDPCTTKTDSPNNIAECDSECKDKEEMQRLKKEIQRLLSENRALRTEIARYETGNEGGPSGSEAGQAFYAGGSERSGQQILGPSKGKKDIVTEVFKGVKERGAVVFEDEPASSSRGGGGAFGGVGYRLGQTADDHEPVTPAGAQAQTDARSVRLRLYREGFTVDQGPLRAYSDPEHAEFLNYIRRGEIPPALASGGEVRVSLEDRRHEDGPRRAARAQPFHGKGQMLGSPTPPTVGASAPAPAPPAPPAAGAPDARAANQRAAQEALKLDETAPTTTIQFRLADGSRVTGRFNVRHTVADLRSYVSRAAPASEPRAFVLLTAFPTKELSDPTATLESANLLNTTLLQRLT